MTTGWSTRPNLPALHKVTAAEMDAVLDQVETLTGAGWFDYSSTFTLTAVSVNPTKGNSTYLARYRQPTGSDLVQVEVCITIGSTFVAGSGVYRFSVPVNASTGSASCAVGVGWIFDSGTANRTGVVRFDAVSYVNWYLNGSTAAIDNTGSGTAWATGDKIAFSLTYEAA